MMQPAESQDEDSEDTSAAGASGGVVDVFSGVSIRVSRAHTPPSLTLVFLSFLPTIFSSLCPRYPLLA